MKGGPGTPDEGPASPGGERTHEGPPKVLVRHKQSDRGLWFRHSSGAPELRSFGARKRESRESETGGRGGGRGMAEGQGEDGPGSVGDSGATPMIVVVVLDDGGGRGSGGVGRRKKKRQRGGG